MISRYQRHIPVLAALLTTILSTACEKVPLLAPTGSTITLTSATTALPTNGTATIVAQVLESSGTPPHSGTRINFTTSLGTVEPSEVSTDASGRATVTFRAGGQSGVATIAAASGGATTVGSGGSTSGTTGGTATTSNDRSLRIAVGAAAVGRVILGASPTLISSQGGSSTLTAAVTDINGNPLSAVPVIFTTTAGSLNVSSVNTDANGIAISTLTTSVEATVTATAGLASTSSSGSGGTATTPNTATITIKVNPVPTLAVKPVTSGTLTAGTPVTFEISASIPTGSTSQIRDMLIDFGDGTRQGLGAASGTSTVQHIYDNTVTRSFTVTVTLTDTLGGITTASTVIAVLPQPPLGAAITFTKAGSLPSVTVAFTATVTPATATVTSYVWDFGDGQSQTTTANSVVKTYNSASVYTVRVNVTTTTGQTTQGVTAVSVP